MRIFFNILIMLSTRVVVTREIIATKIKNNYKVIMVGKCGFNNSMVVEVIQIWNKIFGEQISIFLCK